MKKLFFSLALVAIASSSFAQKKVALVFDAGGKNDRSFNQSSWEGAQKAEKDFGIKLSDVEPADTTATEQAIRNFATQNFDLIIGIGFAMAPAIEKAAKDFPKIKFAIVDSRVDQPNVASLEFKEQEGSFLVGAIAGLNATAAGKTSVGFIGGMDIPLIHKFQAGYAQGVKAVNPKLNVITNYVGNTPSAWNDPAKAKEIAEAQMSKGASVIYAAAGGSGTGLFDAIKEKNGSKNCVAMKASCVFAVGVDSNQNYILPGQILTSMQKRVDVAVYNTIKDANSNAFKGGARLFGVSSNGVGYAIDQFNKDLISAADIAKVEAYKKDIISGKIVVNAK